MQLRVRLIRCGVPRLGPGLDRNPLIVARNQLRRLFTYTFTPCSIPRVAMVRYFTGCPGTNSNLKKRHRIAVAIFICRYAESLPKQIRGPPCTTARWLIEFAETMCYIQIPSYV